MIIALLPSLQKPQAREVTRQIIECCRKLGIEPVMEEENASSFGTKALSSFLSPKTSSPPSTVDLYAKENTESIDFLMPIGGDGTMLRYAHAYRELSIPMVGINLGRLGFMADVPIEGIEESLQGLRDGNYTIEKRITVEGTSPQGKRYTAINEFAIHRARNPSLIEISIQIDGHHLNTFRADGMILSTPNGSTGYSLAAGGPIVMPTLSAVILTPISPHTISNRPMLLTDQATITMSYESDFAPIEVVADGMTPLPLSKGESFSFRKSDWAFPLVRFLHHDFFTTLRLKLGWSGKIPIE